MSAPASAAAGGKRKFASNSSAPSSSSSHKGGDKKFKRSFSDKGGSSGGGAKPWLKKGGFDKSKKKPEILTRKDRQEKRKERKALKPNADLIAEANKMWQGSFVNIPASERQAKVGALLSSLSGKVAEVGLKHDASRAIQLAVKYASEEQKHILIRELSGSFKQLAEDRYAHYIVIKLLSNDTKKGDAKKQCLKEFKTHVVKLSTQPDSAKVLDYLYASVGRKDQNSLLQEFYSPEFVIFSEDEAIKDKTLEQIFEAKPEKKMQVMDTLRKYLDKSLEKNMITFRFLHALLLEYIRHSSAAELGPDFLPSLAQFLPALHHSEDGCRLLCHLLSVGGAKERKNLLKHFKGLVGHMAERAEGVWVLSCALDVVDDTVLLEKSVFAELLPTLAEQLTHQYSSRIYLHVLNPQQAAIFSKEEQQNYSVSGRWLLSRHSAEQGPLSKKEPALKRLELLGLFLPSLLTTLATLPDTLGGMLRTSVGHHLLVESAKEAWRLQHDAEAQQAANAAPVQQPAKGKKKGGKQAAKEEEPEGESAPAAPASRFPAPLAKKLAQLATQLSYVFDSIVRECGAPLGSATDGVHANPLEDRFGHYAVKRLLALEPTPDQFAAELLRALGEQWEAAATTNRSAFVLSSILELDLQPHATALRKELQPLLGAIQAAAARKPQPPKKEAEDAEMADGEKPFVGKKKRSFSAHSSTNAGVELLARLLAGQKSNKAASAAVAPATPAPKAKASQAAPKSAAKPPAVKKEAPQTPAAKPATAAKKVTAKKGTAKKKAPAAASADDMED